MKLTVYTSDSQKISLAGNAVDMFRDLNRSRGLAWQLTVRDIKSQYRQSILGLGWAFLTPLTHSLIWILLQLSGIIGIQGTGISYPLFAFSGALLWSVFMESLQAPLTMTFNARSITSKIRFPHEAIILSGIYQTLFNGLIKVFLILILFILFGVYPGLNLLLFPFAFLSLILAGTAIGLFLTPLGMLYNDIGRAIPVVLQILMYTTPIVFPIPSSGWGSLIIRYNPLTQLFMPCRDWLTGSETIFLNGFLIVNGCMLILLFSGWIIYRLVIPIINERLNA